MCIDTTLSNTSNIACVDATFIKLIILFMIIKMH